MNSTDIINTFIPVLILVFSAVITAAWILFLRKAGSRLGQNVRHRIREKTRRREDDRK